MSAKAQVQVKYTVIAMLAMLLLGVAVFLPILLSSGDDAAALDVYEQETVRQALDDYIAYQYQADSVDGESGFIVEADTGAGNCAVGTLKKMLDSNCDGTYLGEGDDAAGAPILVDVLDAADWGAVPGSGIIPGTTYITKYNAGGTYGPATASDTATTAIADMVTNRQAAGIGTDIVTYCLTGHTESVATGAMGAISQAGGYGACTAGSGGDCPKVYDLKWGRYGWDTGSKAYSNANTLGSPATTTTFTDATNADCTGSTPDSELVRCTAEAASAIVGAGTTPPYTGYEVIDLRSGDLTGATVNNGVATYQIPLDTVFNTGLNAIDPDNQVLFANRTQHTAGIVAVGATMLGYDASFSKWGLADYNNALEEQMGATMGYGLIVGATTTDTTAPGISNVQHAPTNDGGIITWTTDEPATSVLEWSTTQGGPYTKVNDTVLHGSHTATITGQAAGATIYYRVSSYDGQANGGTPTTEDSFITLRQVNHTTDKVYYMPWYDSMAANGWQGDWIIANHISGSGDADVEVRLNGLQKDTHAIAMNDSGITTVGNTSDGIVEVICWDCNTDSDSLVASQRTLFNGTFNELMAVEWADLADTWYFPFYDNNGAGGMIGDWIMIANPDTTEATVDVEINGAAVTESPVTVPAGKVVPVMLAATTVNGPVSVAAQGGQKLMVTQRVLYGNSFNEFAGMPVT